MAKPTELPHITGQVSYAVEQAILRLRESLDDAKLLLEHAHARIDALPPIYTLDEIQQALGPLGSNPVPTASLLNTTPPDTEPLPPPADDDGIPDYEDIVTEARNSLGIGPESSDGEMFYFIRTVVENINNSGENPSGIDCGLTDAPPGGSNVFTCQGNTYRYARVTFSNDHTFKCIVAADPGDPRTAAWNDEGVWPGFYRAAIAPGSPC